MNADRPEFYVVIERDEDGFFVGEVPQLRACYSQGRTIDELMANMRDVISLSLEEEPEYTSKLYPEPAARAGRLEPEILLVDESLSSLDAAVCAAGA